MKNRDTQQKARVCFTPHGPAIKEFHLKEFQPLQLQTVIVHIFV